MNIDYTKLNDRIVKQACEFNNLVLTEELKTRLFQNKIKRAADAIKAREQSIVYHQIDD
jgi:low affinity Fe/Cu permease